MLGSSASFLRLIRFLVLIDLFQNMPTFHKCPTYPPAGGTSCFAESSRRSRRSHASRCPSLARILALCPFLWSGQGAPPSLQGEFSLPSPPTYWVPSPPTFTGTQTHLLIIPFVPYLYNSFHGGLPPGWEHIQNFSLKTSRRASK